MDGFYLSIRLDEGHTLCIAPLTNRNIALSGQEIEDISGYFLFEKRGPEGTGDVEVIAHLLSEDAALRVGRMFNMS